MRRQDISVRWNLAAVALCIVTGLFGVILYVSRAVTLTNFVINSVGLAVVAGLNLRSAKRKRRWAAQPLLVHSATRHPPGSSTG